MVACRAHPEREQVGPTVTTVDARVDRRSFAAGDMIRLLVGLVLVLVGVVIAEVAQETIRGLEEDLVRAIARLPDRIEQTVLGLVQLVTSLVPLTTLVVLLIRRRWRVAALLLAAGWISSLVMAAAGTGLLDRGFADLIAELGASDDSLISPGYPDSRVIASTTAIVTVAAPWLSRQWKRVLWGTVAALVVLRLIAVAHPALDLVLALGVGTVVGSALLLIFGSPIREPTLDELRRALSASGFGLPTVEPPRHARGALHYAFTDADGARYTAILRTPEQRDAEFLQRLYRRLRFRSSEVRTPYATIKRRVEHEALMLALADRAGARVPTPARIGTTTDGSAFYVATRPQVRPATADDLRNADLLDDLWRQLRDLHAMGVAHRRLSLEVIRVDDEGHPWLVGFDRADTAPGERERARDVAELLTETAIVVGIDPAVSAAVGAMGPEAVGSAMRMLQPLALPSATRARAKAEGDLLERLRAAVNAATGEPDVELEALERVRPRTIMIVVASSLAFYSLLPQLANFGETLDAFRNARPGWLLATVAASGVTYLFAAVSFQGSVAEPLPFGANVRAQVAASFAGLVGPGGAGGFALTGRFLERAGVRPAEAGASVAVNAIAGFAMHIALLAGFVLWAGGLGLDGFSLPDSNTVLLIAAVLFAVVGLLIAIAPVRRRVFTPLLRALRVGARQIGRVFTSPQRVAALFGGSGALSLTYVAAAAAAVQAFGGGLTFGQIGAAYLAAMALATLAPTPGGLGAVESAMIAAFTGFGLGAGVAVSATLAFRLATFWLPLLPGWLTLGVMRRRDEI